MRMWLIDPALMCRKHLLGEHVELHMLAGSIQRGRSISGFLYGLVEPSKLYTRHDELVAEMLQRGYNHKSPLPLDVPINSHPYLSQFSVNANRNRTILADRCLDCRNLIKGIKEG